MRILKAVNGNTLDVFTPGGSATRRAGGLSNSQGNVEKMFKAFQSVVFACINARAKEVANTADFIARQTIGQKKYRDLPHTHPLVALLANPNPYLTPFFYWYSTVAFLDISGNAYSWIARDGLKRPRALWPIHPKAIKIIPGDRAKGEPIIKGYNVRWDGVRDTYVPEEEILHLRHPNPDDLYYYGNSLVMRAAYEIDIHDFILKFQKAFFDNYAMPAFMLLYPGTMDTDVRKRFMEQWDEKYRSNPGKFYLAEGAEAGTKLDVMASKDEMSYLQSRGVNVTSLLGIFGVPPSKLMITENLESRATADSMNYVFHLETIDPLLTMIEQQLTVDLAHQLFGDERIVIQHTPTIPTDAKTQAEIDNLQLQGKTRFINELRERDGLPPVVGGDEPLVDFTLSPLSAVVRDANEPKDDPGNDPPTDEIEQRREDHRQDRIDDVDELDARRPAGAVMKGLPDERQKTAIWKSNDRLRNRWEVRMVRHLKYWYSGVRDDVLSNIRTGGRKTAGDIVPVSATPLMFNVDDWLRKLQTVVSAQTLSILKDSFDRFVNQYQVDGVIFAPNSPLIKRAMEVVNSKTITVPRKLHDDLFAELDEGIRMQETAEQLSVRVSRFFGDIVDYRSLRIARTVSNYAVNRGGRVAATDAGFNVKGWLTMRDSRVRDTHAAMDGVKVPINEKFQLPSGDQLDVPGDPEGDPAESINCRCSAYFAKE